MGRTHRVCCLALSLAVSAMVGGCKQSTEKLSEDTKTFNLKGKIVSMDAAQGELTIQHEAIPGFMDAMTMPYKLVYGEEMSELHEGDVIRARLLVDKTRDGDYRHARIDEIAVLSQMRPNYKPKTAYHVPSPGDLVPDFDFTNQDSKPIHLGQFKGKVLLITFIYTRCPLDDFCPKMTRNFLAIDRALRTDRGLYFGTQLLSLSFDPAFDSPSVLRAYGEQYVSGEGFRHWQFAAPKKDSLPAIDHFFNVGVTSDPASGLTHSLSTVLIDQQGRIADWYPGSEWQPEEVVAKMRSLTAAPQAKIVVDAANQKHAIKH